MAESTPESLSDVTGTDGSPARPVMGDIREEWPWVQRGVEEILKQDPHLTFVPEDVYKACVSKEAILWITDEGFVVMTGETDPFTQERTCFLWLAWAKKRGTNLVQQHQDFFIRAASEAGFAKIETRSGVPALQEHLTGAGWDVETIVYSRRL